MSKFPFKVGEVVVDRNNVEFLIEAVSPWDQMRIHCSLVNPDSVKGFTSGTMFCFEWPHGDGRYLIKKSDITNSTRMIPCNLRAGDVFFDEGGSRYDLKEITGDRFFFDVTRTNGFTILVAIHKDHIEGRLASDLRFVSFRNRGWAND